MRRVGIAVLSALVNLSCGGRWGYDGSYERPSRTLAQYRDVPVGNDLGFTLERAGDALVVVATTTPMCRRARYAPYETVISESRTGLFGHDARTRIDPGNTWWDEWVGERAPCPGAGPRPLVNRAVTVGGHLDALGTEYAYWTRTTDAEGRAHFDPGLEGAFAWTAAFCGHGTLQVRATPIVPENPMVGEPQDTPTDPKVIERGELILELDAPMAVPGVDTFPWRYASRCRYGGVAGATSDPDASARALAMAGADAERAMALDACFVGVTSACRPACAAGDPLGCQLECQNGGGLGCDAVGATLLASGDATRAARYFAMGCQAGAASACEHLAGSVERGETGQPADPAAALALHQKACDAGDAAACQAAAAAQSTTTTSSALVACDSLPQSDEVTDMRSVSVGGNQGGQIIKSGGCTWSTGDGYKCGPSTTCHGEIVWTEQTFPCLANDGSTTTSTVKRAGCSAATSAPDAPEVAQVVTPLVDDWNRAERITPDQPPASAPDCPMDQCHCWAKAVVERGGFSGTIQPAC